jgi:hypothetical protein
MQLVRFSSNNCGQCGRAALYDAEVSQEEGLPLLEVKVEDKPTYHQWIWVLALINFQGFPSYALVEGKQVIGSFAGSMPRGTFRKRLLELKDKAVLNSKLANVGTR